MLASLCNVLGIILFLFWLLLIARVIIEFIQSVGRDWHPQGFTAVILEVIMTLTDLPVKLLRKVIPQVTIGSVRIDLSILLLLFVIFSVMEWLLQQ